MHGICLWEMTGGMQRRAVVVMYDGDVVVESKFSKS